METLFLLLCAALFAGVAALARKSLRSRARMLVPALVAADLAALALLARAGFFNDFSSLPPHLAVAILPWVALLVFFASREGVGKRLSGIPPFALVGFQAFRILMELILYGLVEQRRLPEILTFTGSNYDILVAITAPVMAGLLLHPDRLKTRVALAWNGMGLLILGNTVAHGILAAPTPFQVFKVSPPNTLIAEFPWIWLPGFVVPCALLGHVLSIRQLLARRNGYK